MKKQAFCNSKKRFFLTAFLGLFLTPLALHFKDDLESLEGAPITFLITQNGEELRKICQIVR
jgi:hypothetical protein